MHELRQLLKPSYAQSHALVIGINKYKSAGSLGYAVSDAAAVKELLINSFGFASENVRYLSDEEATRANITGAYMRFTRDDVDIDDKIIVFFAGHGHTVTGSRGEVGYLIPYDGNTSDYSTLIRWDDFTRGADLIRAKHLLFIMDACYSGLALTRSVHPGSTRYLKDMMRRFARQVLTAGKADEVVADAGGPIANHSIFTGHLIEGLQGKAATDGIITANGLMAYVHQKVATDGNSDQTPHYGTIAGDGDFIFKAPQLDASDDNGGKDVDFLFSIPSIENNERTESTEETITTVKRLLADDSSTIALHDLVTRELRAYLSATNDDMFSAPSTFDIAAFPERLEKYESASFVLSQIGACVSYWAKPAHQPIVKKIITRSTDRFESHGGNVVALSFRWYPILLEFYSVGISAVAGQRYDTLENLFNIENDSYDPLHQSSNLLDSLTGNFLELIRSNIFKSLPDFENRRTPISDYIFKLLQPRIDELLFLGKRYESAFNEFEILYGLAVTHKNLQKGMGAWGPIGRFAWNLSSYTKFMDQAEQEGTEWTPWKSGIFKGTYPNFAKTLSEHRGLISRAFRF
jgi:hypothetical protein